MKLAILGGGGVRMPAFVRAVLTTSPGLFDEISLFEPQPSRRDTICRLAAALPEALGCPPVVTVTDDAEAAFTGADYVFSAIRVGGDRGRVIDEQVALRRGLVGQETTGAGGCAMALRTIPVVLAYCELLRRCAPDAVLINFTNPAGLITQAICAQGLVTAVGVCDTPGGTVARLAEFLGVSGDTALDGSYAGLNHLGWVCSLRAGGRERIGELISRFEELRRYDHRFAAFDPALVRRAGAVPAEYVYYYYDPARYVREVARAGTSRGQDVLRLNSELLGALSAAFAQGDLVAAWSAYDTLMGVRSDTYMRTDTDGDAGQAAARRTRAGTGPADLAAAAIGGYEGLALRVIGGLAGRQPAEVIVNLPVGASLGLDPGDVVELPARADRAGLTPLPAPDLPRPAAALVEQVKDYERGIVAAALSGDADLAAVALAGHPLVPGLTVARELIAEYRDLHGPHLAYLH
ncbi:MAG TPA: 6-phospho-beta-glucosidase [Streptosporangiaceae bacterium]|nr:6-phospho-beta-glucosidase [Streptosporangiaceae bacterium]